MALLKVTEDQE